MHELNQLLDAALELPPEERPAWVDAHAGVWKERLHGLLARDARLATLPKLDEPITHFRCAHFVDERVGPYRLLRRLGAGSMGAVWLAARTDGLAPAHVALKFAHVAPRRWELQARLEREQQLLRALDHPNIARLYDAGVTDEGQPYLVLEYVEGRPLDGTAPLVRRLALFAQLVDAVTHAHACQIVHRDLKPANVLVTGDGMRLLDFGIGKLLATEPSAFDLSRATGQPLTPAYASPEQLLGEAVGLCSDVYSLGVILFELLTGKRPHEGSNLARREATLEHAPVAPSTLYTGLDAEHRARLDRVVARALQKDPRMRFASAGELRDALRAPAPR